MFYEAEFAFFKKIIKNMRINSYISVKGELFENKIDGGIREFLNISDSYDSLIKYFWQICDANTVNKVTDEFFCNYIAIPLPYSNKEQILIAGPYISTKITREILYENAEKYSLSPKMISQIEKYYSNIPHFDNDDTVISVFNSLGEIIWGGSEKFLFRKFIHNEIDFTSESVISAIPKENENSAMEIEAIETRYAAEKEFLNAISRGMLHKAEQFFANTGDLIFEKRNENSLRNSQNYMIIMNTLLRKSIECKVHPIYIDRLSSEMAKKIEAIKSEKEITLLQKEMLKKYCNLVKRQEKFSEYSLPIQKVISIVDFDLSADLSLKALARTLNLNPSYLSSLFKKKTGETLTDYVTKKRIDNA
ncbi:MAG: helix-turn-helix domain-containing protein, partial [Eubacterium sp.]